jgi:hypothetical protein
MSNSCSLIIARSMKLKFGQSYYGIGNITNSLYNDMNRIIEIWIGESRGI